MSEFENLDGIGDDVDGKQVDEALSILRASMSLMETDRENLYNCIRALEVLYDREPERPDAEDGRIVYEVLENVDEENVTSLDPSHVDDVLLETLIEVRKAQGIVSE